MIQNYFLLEVKFSNLKLETTVNSELNKISTWFELNKLSLNVKKPSFRLFASKHDSSNNSSHDTPEIIKDELKIEQVHSSKFLGVTYSQIKPCHGMITFMLFKRKFHKSVELFEDYLSLLSISLNGSICFTLSLSFPY